MTVREAAAAAAAVRSFKKRYYAGEKWRENENI